LMGIISAVAVRAVPAGQAGKQWAIIIKERERMSWLCAVDRCGELGGSTNLGCHRRQMTSWACFRERRRTLGQARARAAQGQFREFDLIVPVTRPAVYSPCLVFQPLFSVIYNIATYASCTPRISAALINTIMSRGLHLSQVFDLKGKVAFVTGK
jgi:hypothetical protein